MKRLAPILAILLTLGAPAAWAAKDVVNTRHNLSAVPPVGVTRTFASATVTEVCVFCHTPHSALPAAPLWNHLPTAQINYTLYGSSTLKSTTVGQPTGKSRLCLACHDGTIALGALQKPPAGVVNDLSATMLTGRANLGTNLSNDHPISFAYDAALQAANGELASPAGIGLPLEGSQVQCTTCHDPHEKDLAPFLHQSTLNGQLCTTCHTRTGWAASTHATSAAAVAPADLSNRRPEWVKPTVAGNSCLGCHTPHNALGAARLLAKDGENTCYGCHDGTPASNIQADFAKVWHHPVELYPGVHDATKVENAATMALHVECADCHNPHTVKPDNPMISFNPNNVTAPHATAPAANNVIKGVTGVGVNGLATTDVTNQYELCFKCHGQTGKSACGTTRCGAPKTHSMVRHDGVYNIRSKVVPGTPGLLSYHPLVSNNPANNAEVPSLKATIPLNTSTSLIYCTDCHSSDTSGAAGGTGADGPHGSTWEGQLAQQYTFNTNPANSTVFYALCYKCHDEAVILSSASFVKHAPHIQNRGGSCILCHDPHGSHKGARLINFLTSSDGAVVIGPINVKGQPDPTTPRWVDTGVFTGECWLNCHNAGHSPKTY